MAGEPMQDRALNNFLLPNGTFFAEFLLFVIVLTVMWRFVLPPLQKAMNDRQAMIRQQVEEGAAARKRLEQAEQEYRAALAETRAESTRIREEARVRGQEMLSELKDKAAQEYESMSASNEARLAAERSSILATLRPQIGELAGDLAGRIVGEPLGDSAARASTVGGFLDRLGERGEHPERSATPPDGATR